MTLPKKNSGARYLWWLSEVTENSECPVGYVSHATWYNWEKSGRVKLTRIGGKTGISDSELRRLAGETEDVAA